MGWKIYLPQDILPEGREYLESHGHTLVMGTGTDEETLCREIKGMDAMVCRTTKITRKVFEAADQLKVVARHGAGFDFIDVVAAKDHGVMCVFAPTANSDSVAETAVMNMLIISRNFKAVQKEFLNDYMKAKMKIEKHTLHGKTLGIIGCGKKVDKGAAGEGGAKKVVNVAFTNYYVPYDFVNDKGEPDGFEVAVMQAVAKKLPQYEWKFTPTSDDDLLIGVESGKYTIGTKGIWKTPAREKKYIFPKNNIGASVIGLVIRKDEAATIKSIDDLAKTQGKLAPIAPQDARYNVIASYNTAHPDQKINLVSSENFHNSDAYTWVMEGRYDAYLEVELSYQNNIAKENAPYHRFADQLVYLRYKGIPTYALVNKKEVKLCEEVDKAIEELRKDGTIDKLEQKYFGESLQKYLNQK